MAAQRQAELKERDLKLAELERDANRNFGTTFIITLIILLVTLFDLFVTKVIKATFCTQNRGTCGSGNCR